MPPARSTLRYDLQVPDSGCLEVAVPFPVGSQVTVFVVETPVDESDDLLPAASSSTDFWNNPFDDEDWNNA